MYKEKITYFIHILKSSSETVLQKPKTRYIIFYAEWHINTLQKTFLTLWNVCHVKVMVYTVTLSPSALRKQMSVPIVYLFR